MELRLDGKTALVTGASSGLGERFATVLAESGARVALAARRVERLEGLKAAIAKRGGEAFSLDLDVTKVDEIEPAIARIENEFGSIHILVNNAGVSRAKYLSEVEASDFDYVMNTNFKGAFFVAQSVARRMMKRRAGRIINIASLAGLKVLPRIGVYAMSKAGVIHMTRAMALEWGRYGINVNAICPGYIETEMNRDHWSTDAGKKLLAMLPRNRVGQPADLDGLLVYLASDSSGFVNGAVINADDGFGVA